jgi:NAD(P)-dependent dehydrogenase (short-subunit alcohol dehydrogenase family)
MQQTKSPARPLLNLSLEGQRIVIIGGTSGFGMATAKAASAEGASVIVASSKKTRTELWQNMTESDRNGLFEKAGQTLPVGRVGEPGDLAETYLYLMRERFSTGAMIVVDGGGTLA